MRRSRSSNPVIVAVVTAVALAIGTALAMAGAFEREGDTIEAEAPSPIAAVFAHGNLWLSNHDGTLVAMAAAGGMPRTIASAAPIRTMCRSGDDLVVAMGADSGPWAIGRRTARGWSAIATIPSGLGDLVGLACSPSSARLALVTRSHLIDVGDTIETRALSSRVDDRIGATTGLIAGDHVWLGNNVGEWGGGLTRIDPTTGERRVIAANRTGALCGGPLNTDCDPVTGLAPSRFDPSCVIATIGLDHLMTHGRLVEICGTRVRRLYFKPSPPQPRYGESDDGEPASTIAFFGLARTAGALWAVGNDGVYRFDESGTPDVQRLPRLEKRGGYRVSFAIPGIVLVATGANRQYSLSGVTPLIAAR